MAYPTINISESDINRYHEEGAIVVRSVVSRDWIEKLRDVVEWALLEKGKTSFDHEKEGQQGRFFEDQFLWKRNDTAREFIFEGPMSQIASKIMRSSKVNLFYDHILSKEPGTSTPTPWHNDMSYYQLKGDQMCSIWLALDPVGCASCVKYWSGSHKAHIYHKISSFAGENTYPGSQHAPLPDVDSLAADGKIQLLDWDMEPGDVLIHHGFTVHGAPGNRSSSVRRRGYVTRWMGDDVTFDARPGTIYPGWQALGYECGLEDGDKMDCGLHPAF